LNYSPTGTLSNLTENNRERKPGPERLSIKLFSPLSPPQEALSLYLLRLGSEVLMGGGGKKR